MFVHLYLLINLREASQRFALPALGRAAERRPTGKMLRRGKMLGIAPESPASGARFVSPLFDLQATWVPISLLLSTLLQTDLQNIRTNFHPSENLA